jgi:hypothetical protein
MTIMENLKFIIVDSLAGNLIESFQTLEEAQKCKRKFESDDQSEGIFEFGFYEIYDSEKEEIVG